ncbi:hypothetical protein IFM89_028001 [Coptis chinensis]|uniref:Myb/SANT-like domain-containing protein n=1 Tax=Coptis chinensis TaxID=261450 RepID=A0A835HKG9_9MAGN|nr:hypothetical protein IFM89_028001 [Coptis chinensis]
MENEMKSVQVPSSKWTNWTAPMDRYFVKLMVDQVHDGQYLDGQFSKHAWRQMEEKFKAKFGPSFTTRLLKNHYRALKKNYNCIKTLLSESGFGWDNEREMVYADHDHVWDDYIKVLSWSFNSI